MKKIIFEIRVDELGNRIATAWKTDGYARESICDNLEIIGILDNTKNLINDRIKTLMERNKDL